MLKDIDLGLRLDKAAYKAEIAALERELAGLQYTIKERQIPVVIVLEGFSASGKGTLIGKVTHPLDPRFFSVHNMHRITEDEARRPFLWGYWTRLPVNGEIAIFDKSWNRTLLSADKHVLGRAEFYNDVNAFERQLRDSGTVLVKLFMHISRDEQARRLRQLQQNPATAWRVNDVDLEQNANYDDYARRFDKVLLSSDEPWHIVEAEDRRYATVKAYRIIVDAIHEEVTRREQAETPPELPSVTGTALSGVDPVREVTSGYGDKLERYQRRLAELGFELYGKQRAVTIVYEGWDAAGKGGNIKRLTQELDPRGYEVVPIAAPSRDELAHHYLWRFYQKLPKDGHIAIFDRSWYGRVMVERIEGFAGNAEWRRAYREINEMERHLSNHGMIILKFWLHIDKDEQLLRFNRRLADPAKRNKITDEDWRNREKWNEYEAAVNEMLARTDTDYAPWDIVPANNKKFARLHVLKRVVNELEKRLGHEKS